jgi:beta-lactamase regulating signal transducer with metallopeptidase domain/protocatechuate 3,4-dioxygenase beta subunit
MIETLNSGIEWLNRLGAVHWGFASAMFVQTLVLVPALGVFEFCLRRRVRAVVRYWIWSLVLLKLMLPVTLGTPASIAYWIVKEQPVVVTTSPAPHEAAPAMPADPVPSERAMPSASSTTEGAALPMSSTEPNTMARSAASEPRVPVVTRPIQLATLGGPGWFILAWLGGVLVLSALVARRIAKVWRLARQAAEAPAQLYDPLHAACVRLRASARRIRVRISDEVGCPAICGFWRPTILVPRRLVGQLDDEQFELVFAHEVSHWKQWDLQINLLQTVLQVVYFYNPAVWIANAVLRRLREEAVDDAVLVAAAAKRERYSNTLLDVAAQSLVPAEISLRLIGILESRTTLAQRICRMASGTLPQSARLGVWGLCAVAIVAIAFLPMAGRRAIAQKPAGDPPSVTPDDGNQEKVTPLVLSGLITDESGKPVSDATIELIHVPTGVVQDTKTAQDGSYFLDRAQSTGEHRLIIESDRCLGLTDWDNCPHVILDPKQPIVRNFTLKPACQLRVQTVDEEGKPIAGVYFFQAGPTRHQRKLSDGQGWTTVGGLTPGEHVFAAQSPQFAIARLTVKFDSSPNVVERKLVLIRGVAIKGSVHCSDSKPAAGWKVRALPSWWAFYSSPNGELIQDDGSFVLPHIGPGAYNVTIMMPRAGGSLGSATVLTNAELANRRGPLALRVDSPSHEAMGTIWGHLRFVGGRPQRTIWINAQSAEHPQLLENAHFDPQHDRFRLGPLPRGRYHLRIDSPEIETKEIASINVPGDDLEIEIQVHGPLVLRGSVVAAGTKGPKPVSDFRIRVVKLKNLRGTNFIPKNRWRNVSDVRGEFSEEVTGPGIYVVEATADGLATTRSEPINTDQLPKNGVRLLLTKGVRLSGTVVDEEGRPIDGARVISRAKVGGRLPTSAAEISEGTGVRTVNGRFQFDGLTPGKEDFRVLHPDYALASVQNFELRAQGHEPLAIVLKRGGTVSGHLRDEHGRPIAGAQLHFQRYPFSFFEDPNGSRFATAVTDENGAYEVRHLPEELIHILRDQGRRTLGVFHMSVLPVNGQTRTIEFGGAPNVSGQLFVNGVPHGGKKLLLADDDSGDGDFGATTVTEPDGTFAFSGIPVGKRALYLADENQVVWDEWKRIESLDVGAAPRNFGRIDFRAARLTVKVVGPFNRPSDQVNLRDYDPRAVRARVVARPRLPHPQAGPFIFNYVRPGKYDVFGSGDQRASINRMIEITPDDLNPTVTLEWPQGTASIRGTIDGSLRKLVGNGWFVLYSAGDRWEMAVRVEDDGRLELNGIPAGSYSLAMNQFRSGAFIPVRVADFPLRDGETKTLTITPASVPRGELSKEALKVTLFTSQGIPLPCADIRLTGPNGPVQPNDALSGHLIFVAAPGSYQLSVVFPGARTVTRAVELKSTPADAPPQARNQQLDVTIGPID